MVSWPPYSYQEILQLLHLDSTPNFNHLLKIAPDGRSCLMQQLVIALQKFSFRINTHDAAIQTQDLDRFNAFRQEFETRVNGEVALQVNRVREYETNALRMEEACHYRRQLAKDREELEELHKARLERIHEREESLMERLLLKEKAIETGAYEHRQKLLADITSLRDRQEKLQEREEQQVRREEKLAEQEKYLKMREEDICHMRETLYARVDESAAMKMKELEDQYRSKNDQLQSDRGLLEAKWAMFHEEKARLANELRAANVDKELVISLHERLASEGEQRQSLLNQIENICQQQNQKWAHEQKKMQKIISKLEADLKKSIEVKEGVVRSRKTLQLQLRHSESELLDTVTLLKKTQHALELERLHHYSLRSQIGTFFSSTSEDKLQGRQDLKAVELKETFLRNTSETGALARRSLDKEPGMSFAEIAGHHRSSSQSLIRTKPHSQSLPGLHSERSLRALEAKTVSNSFPQEVQDHEDHSRTYDGVRAASLHSRRGDRGESSSTDLCSRSSINKHVNLSGEQKWGPRNEHYEETVDKECFRTTIPEVSSLTGKKSPGGAQKTSYNLPTTGRKKSHRAKKKTITGAYWEPNQSSTTYYMMGATSLKSSNSALEFKMMEKAMKLSTSVDDDHNQRRHTEVYATKFQQNIQKTNAEADSDRQRLSEVPSEVQDQATFLQMRSQESEGWGKMTYEGNLTGEDKHSPDSSGAGGKQTSWKRAFVEHREEVNTVKEKRNSPSLKIREYHGGETTSQAQGILERHDLVTYDAAEVEVKPEIGIASHEKNTASEPSFGPTPDHIDREANGCGLSAMVLEELKRFSQQLEVSKSLMALEKPLDLDSLGLRTGNEAINPEIVSRRDEQQQATLHNDDEVELTTARQPSDSNLRETVSQKPNPAAPPDQKEGVMGHRSLSGGHSSVKNLPFQNIVGRRSVQNNNNTEGANSEESCSNPIRRDPTVKTTQVSDIGGIYPNVIETLQEGIHTAEQGTQRWDVQSEQGSHNPEDETTEWVDDYATGDTDQYVEYSESFSVPESNNSPSNESAAAGYT